MEIPNAKRNNWKTVRTIKVRKPVGWKLKWLEVVSGITCNCTCLMVALAYTYLCVYQLVHIHLPPGIEPGNLIRSTLIRPPPGAFFSL